MLLFSTIIFDDSINDHFNICGRTRTQCVSELICKEDYALQSDCDISFEVSYIWDDCYAGVISISNLGENNIGNWELWFNLNSDILKIENAQITNNKDNQYSVISKPFSRVLAPNDTVEIGVLIAGSVENIPSEFELLAHYCCAQNVDVIIDNIELHKGDGVFYVIDEEVSSLVGTVTGTGKITECTYYVEDEFGSILQSGPVTVTDKLILNEIGFGIGYNHVTIVGSNSSSFFASFDVVNFCLDNAQHLGIDIESDKDDDGVCDYLERILETDPYNANSITAEMSDYDSILKSIGLSPLDNSISEYIEFDYSNNVVVPLSTSITSMVIHRSKHPEGTKTDIAVYPKYVADDLTFNDYTYTELCAEGAVFAVANITPESLMWSEMSAIFAAAKRPGAAMNAVLDDMVSTFRNGNSNNVGTTVSVNDSYSSSKYIKYSNTTLTSAVNADSATTSYTTLMKNYVVNYLRNGGNPNNLSYVIGGSNNLLENYVYSLGTTPYPSYGGATALGITIHGWHGHTITLQNYRETSSGFTGTLKFHFYDHFGLDEDDEITTVGFCDWFTLQHYTRFNGNYVPFLTYCDISVPISGNFR